MDHRTVDHHGIHRQPPAAPATAPVPLDASASTVETAKHRSPRTEALWQIPPWRTRAQALEDATEEPMQVSHRPTSSQGQCRDHQALKERLDFGQAAEVLDI